MVNGRTDGRPQITLLLGGTIGYKDTLKRTCTNYSRPNTFYRRHISDVFGNKAK